MSPRFLTLDDVAEELAVSKSQITALLRNGDLLGIQVGGRGQWRIERVKIEKYIDRQYQRQQADLAEMPADLPPDIE